MKKKLIITITTIIIGTIFIVLGMKFVQIKSNIPSVTKIQTVPNVTKKVVDVQKTTTKVTSIPKVATKTTVKPEKAITTLKTINSEVISQTDIWTKTLALVTPQNSTSVFAKLNSMGSTPYLTDEFKKAYSDETITKMTYNITKISSQSLKNNKTGKTDTCEIVNFNFNVKVTIGSITIPTRLFFARNSENRYKITDCAQDSPIRN